MKLKIGKYIKFTIIVIILVRFSCVGYANSNDNIALLGNVVQCDMELNKYRVTYVSKRLNNAFKIGDIIGSVDGVKFDHISEMVKYICDDRAGSCVDIEVTRGKDTIHSVIKGSHLGILSKYILGIGFDNKVSAVCTLSYYNKDTGRLYGVGHDILGSAGLSSKDIGDVECYRGEVKINKGLGGIEICTNTKTRKAMGIELKAYNKGLTGDNIGSLDIKEVVEVGLGVQRDIAIGDSGYIYTDVINNKVSKYGIIVTNTDIKDEYFEIKVVDSEFISSTSGIIAGMSGTPVIINNKLLGVIVATGDDKGRAYVRYAEYMD